MKALILGLLSLALILVGCNQGTPSATILPVTITKTVPGPTVTVTSSAPIAKPNTAVSTLQPANFVLGELIISPPSVSIGDTVTASISVSNTGGIEGTYVLNFNDSDIEDSRPVTIKAEETKVVTYTTTRNQPGIYLVGINGKVGQYTVTTIVSPEVSSPTYPPGTK